MTTKRRCFAYRVYFADDPASYYVVGAPNCQAAIRRARKVNYPVGSATKKRRTVLKVERLYRDCRERTLKTATKGRTKHATANAR
jgi:hypothetical protein